MADKKKKKGHKITQKGNVITVEQASDTEAFARNLKRALGTALDKSIKRMKKRGK